MSYSEAFETAAYCVPSAAAALQPFILRRRGCSPEVSYCKGEKWSILTNSFNQDVVIAIDYAGICHSDIHLAKDEWSAFFSAQYPL